MTNLLYRDDAYRQTADAKVMAINDRGGIILDGTVFYAAAGGQPGDKGTLAFKGNAIPIATAVYDEAKNVVHVPAAAGALPDPGSDVELALDWAIRYRNMRAHTLMHLLCASVPFPVTGGAITEDGGRIDFDIPKDQVPNKDDLAERINALIAADHPVSFRWISDAEMEASPHLIRTMSVKPPMGTGRVRLVAIGADGAVDLQPCGGTHVRSTGEIGRIAVAGIESKGKQNRRIRLAFAA
jgi:misacylated tRNA(Ala) deacylase